MIKIKRLNNINNKKIINKLIDWNYNWWGKENKQSREQVKYYLIHCINKKPNALPQTYIILYNNKVVGMYCITMSDDIERPDLFPWLANGYVDEKYRNKGIYRKLLESLDNNCKELGIENIYCYTKHKGLYEKFGFKFLSFEPLFNKNKDKVRLYKKQIKEK